MQKDLRAANTLKITINTALLILTGITAAFFISAYLNGHFETPEAMSDYMMSFGPLAPLVLTAFQMMQVLVPIFPSMIGYAVGGMFIGPFEGFLCNYIGISLGSLIAFWLAKTYGIAFVKKVISEERYDKYVTWVNTKPDYIRLLALCFLLPMAPDDFLCFFSGLVKIDFKKFLLITVITKPWCLLMYSYLFAKFGNEILSIMNF